MLKFYGLMEQLKEAGLKEFLFLAHTLLKDRAFALVAFIDEYNPLTHRAYDNQVRLSRLWPPAGAGWRKVSLSPQADNLEAEEAESAVAGHLNTDFLSDIAQSDEVADLANVCCIFSNLSPPTANRCPS